VQYDVHRNPDRVGAPHILYFLDIQAKAFDRIETRVVIPLMLEGAFGPRVVHLNPTFVVEGQSVVLATADLASIHRNELGEVVTSLADRRSDILGATDFLFTGI
jgi:toxin CcdB